MKRNWNLFFNKVLMYSVAALLAATSAYSIPKEPCDQNQDVCCKDPAPGPYAFSYPKDIGLSCPRDFHVYADFLLMKATEDGLDYAVENTTVSAVIPLTGGAIHGMSTQSHDWDWDYGFRVGFGFYTNHDAWELGAQWTYIRINNDVSSNIGNGMLVPFWLVPSLAVTQSTHSSARWTGDYNTFDFTAGKPYHVSRYYISQPYFGVRAAWIDQDYLARYGGTIASATNYDANEMQAENTFWGVGLKAGYNGEFLLGSGWSIYGKASGSMLFGKFDITQKTNTLTNNYVLDNSFYANRPNVELALGFKWGKFFNKGKYQLGLNVGYEFIQWWNQNQLRRFFFDNNAASAAGSQDVVSRGDLAFNGFRFGMHCEF